jgi:hypothetical protein
MAECCYIIEKKINGVIHKITLDKEEMSAIWVFYDDFLIEERIENRLRDEFGITDFTGCVDTINDILHRYNKSQEYGCDEESSLSFAFDEYQERIDAFIIANGSNRITEVSS